MAKSHYWAIITCIQLLCSRICWRWKCGGRDAKFPTERNSWSKRNSLYRSLWALSKDSPNILRNLWNTPGFHTLIFFVEDVCPKFPTQFVTGRLSGSVPKLNRRQISSWVVTIDSLFKKTILHQMHYVHHSNKPCYIKWQRIVELMIFLVAKAKQ